MGVSQDFYRETRTIAVEPGLQQYLKQINECALLTAEQECQLANAISAAAQAPTRFRVGDISLPEREHL